MQTQIASDTNVVLAGAQVPILEGRQLRTGMLITALAISHVWEIVEMSGHGREAEMIIQQMPRAAVLSGHTHSFITAGRGQMCSCGMRKTQVKEWLPKSAGKPARAHIIDTDREIHQPEVYGVYAALVGRETLTTVTLVPAGRSIAAPSAVSMWSQQVPIIPELMLVWAPPPELLALTTTQGPVDEDEIEQD